MQPSRVSLEDVPLNRFHQLLTLRSLGGAFVDGYVLSVVGIIIIQLSRDLQLDSFWEGLTAAASLIGIFIGGLMGGWLTNQFGRKRVFYISPIIFIIASILQFYVESSHSMVALRLVVGIAVGIEYPVATALLVEFLPSKSRGPRIAAIATSWFAGAAFAYVVGELILRIGGDSAWRWVLASGGVMGAALLAVRLGTPESPRWLLSRGRDDEAEHIIKRIYGSNFGLHNLPVDSNEVALSFKDLVWSGYGKRLLFVVTFWTCAIIPIFAVYAFAPKVLAALKIDAETGSLGSVAITMFFVAGCILATRTLNVLGRRTVLLSSFIVSSIALIGLGYFPVGNSAVVLILFSLYALFIGGAQVLTLVYPNEIFPTELRPMAVGIGTAFSRIGAAVGTYLVPLSLNGIGIAQTMYAAAGITLVGLVCAWFMAPETRSLSLQEATSLN